MTAQVGPISVRSLRLLGTSVLTFAALLSISQPAQSQFVQLGPKLVGTGAVGFAEQGFSVALSGDGNTAIVGGLSDNSSIGAAWVYTRDGQGVWSQQGSNLVGTGAAGSSQQGYSVGLSGDGNTAIVGGPNDNASFGPGAAWVYTRNSQGLWAQQGSKLIGTGAVGNAFQGASVALSGDGNTAMVGGPSDNSGTGGAAWVYIRSSQGLWTQQGSKLVGTGGVASSAQGLSVALSSDGNTAILGGPNDNGAIGAAWIFTRDGQGLWTQQGSKLVGTGAVGLAEQGGAVALSGDGNTAIVGGLSDNSLTGAAWVFTRSGGVWTQQGDKLVGTGAVGFAAQGRSVALSADGNTAIVGGPDDDPSVVDPSSVTGAVWVFTRSSLGLWTQPGSKLVGNGAVGFANQGVSVALSADGKTIIAGGPADNSPASQSHVGAAWVFIQPTKDDCKNGGWRNFPAPPGPFSNQGQCQSVAQ
jgi:hypothetical protein